MKINITLFPVHKNFWMIDSPQIDIAQLYWDLKSIFRDNVWMMDFRKDSDSIIDLVKLNEIWISSDISNFIDNDIKNFYKNYSESICNNDIFVFPISVLEQFRLEYLMPVIIFSYLLKLDYPDKKVILFWNYPDLYANKIINKYNFIDWIVLKWDNIALKNYLLWHSSFNILLKDKYEDNFLDRDISSNNLDDFSCPDFSWFNLKKYFLNGKLVLPYEISRWCRNNCFYCYYIHKWKSIKKKSINKVISDLTEIKKKYDTNLFHFHDAEINFDESYLDNLCTEIIDKKINIYWTALAIPNNLNYLLLKNMYNAWCRQLRFWIESGSQRILDIIWKNTNLYEIEKILQDCKKIWISVYRTFLVDLKIEKKDDIIKTIKFIIKNKNLIDDIQFCSFWELGSFDINKNWLGIHLSNKKIFLEKLQYQIWIQKRDIIDFIRNYA